MGNITKIMSFLEVVEKLFIEGFGPTLLIFGITLLGALPLGLILSFGARSKFKPLKWLVNTFIWIIRGTPLMLQVLIIFYAPGILGWNVQIESRFVAVIVAFIINYMCYFAVIYRGGIDSISKGQYEACRVLGMSKSQTFGHVILPQVYKRILAPMSNEIITLVKDTSLARVISVVELIKVAQEITATEVIIWPLFFTAVFYLAFNGLLSLLFAWLEHRTNKYS